MIGTRGWLVSPSDPDPQNQDLDPYPDPGYNWDKGVVYIPYMDPDPQDQDLDLDPSYD